MIRFFGILFSAVSSAFLFAAIGLVGLVYLYGRDLPDATELQNYQPKMLSRVYAGTGDIIAEFAHERRIFIPADEIPDLIKQAFISAEDKNFYEHPGVDATGIAKAVVRFAMARLSGQHPRLAGASTITQQVMKNFLVGDERSLERKIKEALLAMRIEGTLSKDQILELYLNEIYLGARSYGIVAAAENYFGKTLEQLEPQEAAFLAALPRAPSEMHPIRNHDVALARRNYVLREMRQNGYLDPETEAAAREKPLETILAVRKPTVLGPAKPTYFTDEIRRQLSQQLGKDTLYEGGLTIRATIDGELQDIGARALRRALEKFDRARGVYHGPAARIESVAAGQSENWRTDLAQTKIPRDIPGWHGAVVLEVADNTARIGIEGVEEDDGIASLSLSGARKWIASRQTEQGKRIKPAKAGDLWQPGDVIFVSYDEKQGTWSQHQIPQIEGAFMAMDPISGRVLALQGGFSYQHSVFNRVTQAKRQPGSSFKPFVYAAALDAGYTPTTIVLDAPVVVRAGGRTWRPKNSSGKFYGPSPLRVGIEQSRNLMTVRIAQAIGMERVAQYAERFGVYEDMPLHLAYALGAGETTLYRMVAAYSMFDNGGKRVEPTLVDRIQDRHGRTMYRHDPRSCQGCSVAEFSKNRQPILFDQRRQIMDPVTARQIVSMMEGVVSRGTASRTVGNLGFPVAGKTGTSNDSRDAWFIGFSPNLVAGCYIGYDTPRPMGRGAYGGTLCGPVFREFMVAAMKTRAPGHFRDPAPEKVVTIKVDAETGERLPENAEGPNVIVDTFRLGTEPELHKRSVVALADDTVLFGGAQGDLPYLLPEGEDAPLDDSQPDGNISSGPQPLRPPANVGLGTGGVY